MDINGILDENIIHLNKNLKDKTEVLEFMSAELKKNQYIDDVPQFINDIYKREREGTTGIGDYIAIPHGQSDSVNQTTISILTLNNEIEWGTLDGNGVKIVILFVVENDEEFEKKHLKLLAKVASKLAHSDVKKALLNATTKNDIIVALMN